MGPFADEVEDHSINAESCEQNRQASKCAEEEAIQTRLGKRFTDHLRQGFEVGHSLVPIERPHLVTKAGSQEQRIGVL